MLQDFEIEALAARIKQGPVHYHDVAGDGRFTRVVGINRNWIEFEGAVPEPAARLENGNYIALLNVEPDVFVELTVSPVLGR